jgi:hypothetical protein
MPRAAIEGAAKLIGNAGSFGRCFLVSRSHALSTVPPRQS